MVIIKIYLEISLNSTYSHLQFLSCSDIDKLFVFYLKVKMYFVFVLLFLSYTPPDGAPGLDDQLHRESL